MSRYRGNNQECPHCGVRYAEFNTGLRYADVYLWFVNDDPDPANWKYKRRHTILGRWHQHKKEMWNYHISVGCPQIFIPGDAFELTSNDILGAVADVPF